MRWFLCSTPLIALLCLALAACGGNRSEDERAVSSRAREPSAAVPAVDIDAATSKGTFVFIHAQH